MLRGISSRLSFADLGIESVDTIVVQEPADRSCEKTTARGDDGTVISLFMLPTLLSVWI